MKRADVTLTARRLAQVLSDQIDGGFVNNLPDDILELIDVAEDIFSRDIPNVRTVTYVIPAGPAVYRFQVAGAGAIATFANTWISGISYPSIVALPYVTTQGAVPLDAGSYRVIEEPNGVVILELLDRSGSPGQTLYVQFVGRHIVSATIDADTTVPVRYERAFKVLVAALLLELMATKAAQNTGTSNLPTDIVQRTTQSQDFKARAKSWMDRYNELVGKASTASGGTTSVAAKGAHGFRDLDVSIGGVIGPLWHVKAGR